MGRYGKAIYGKVKYGATREYIFDRTETDLINGTERAYINYTDLNRIENGMKAISERQGISIVTKTDWEYQASKTTLNNFPLNTQMKRIIGNLNKLITATGYVPSVEVPSSFDKMDIYKMNNLERIIDELELL